MTAEKVPAILSRKQKLPVVVRRTFAIGSATQNNKLGGANRRR